MNVLTRWSRTPGAAPAAAGALIAAAAVASFSAGVNPFSSSHAGGGAGTTAALTASHVLMTTAAVVAGLPILLRAVRALHHRTVAIDLLVSVAAIGALVIGEVWEAAAVTFLFSVGHALEAGTMNRTRSALAELVAAAPDVAVVLRDGKQVEVSSVEVAPGETVLVKNGAQVPVDGVVTGGAAALVEASITGESMPVEKTEGDLVFAGTVSSGGVLQVRATGVGADTTLARIIHRVEEAQDAKARSQTFLERFSAWYTPAIIVLALTTTLVTGDVVLALTLLVIGCPGALVISIPVAIVAGVGRGARDGVLIKGGEHLEVSARIDTVALDKTGTLTEGRPHLTDVVVLAPGLSRADVLTWAARAEAGSEHPLARPVIDTASAEGLPVNGLPERTDPVPGKGIVATLDGHRVAVGNLPLLTDEGITDDRGAAAEVDRLAGLGRTPMVVTLDGDVVGVVAVADRVRAEAREMVVRLHDAGITRVVMLTGDNRRVAEAVAVDVGVDEVRAELLPEDKVAAVMELQADGRVVAMVGDGVNDAPALATAEIGIAMGAAGTGVAIETADIALMNDDLLRVPLALSLARRTVSVMRLNISIALATVGVLLAGVLAGGVTMAVGMLVHQASVLAVILNAMRLLRRRDDGAGTTTAPRTARVTTTQAQPV
ncbi:Cd2+/Zn2+-exporting ATPase [Georgenia satyanarayanai]|uniref:Cd2+/Zn2+-exporting ATPase n=1 Tax=Georgenia satyanarayanai TaxID=860221 RepID=A0A2Y9AN22_9MICO|nr:cation-translocating P-type ATPase [Georgenia satyanarayanai]PYF97882.1 Cd2+/Zn2+-exporting ATPase [Georgenia satyanarayanai]SSA45456.1 Cd2+/Zn2+-exporting ATPase [Georgenia satyanarayanai]